MRDRKEKGLDPGALVEDVQRAYWAHSTCRQRKASPTKVRRLLMCWQLLACIPSALAEGDNIRPRDARWANADWARAHPCGLGVCRRRGRLRVASSSKTHPVHMFAAQTRPYGARSPEVLKDSARAVPNPAVPPGPILVAMQEAGELTQDQNGTPKATTRGRGIVSLYHLKLAIGSAKM